MTSMLHNTDLQEVGHLLREGEPTPTLRELLYIMRIRELERQLADTKYGLFGLPAEGATLDRPYPTKDMVFRTIAHGDVVDECGRRTFKVRCKYRDRLGNIKEIGYQVMSDTHAARTKLEALDIMRELMWNLMQDMLKAYDPIYQENVQEESNE